MTNTERLEQSAALLIERSKSSPRTAELAALTLHQEVLETLVSGGPATPKRAKSAKSARKSSKSSPATPASPTPDSAPE